MTNIVFVGFNPDGAKSKLTTIKKLIRDTKAAVVTMQETKCQQTGQVNFDGFYTYEHLRSKKEGGGVAVSALKVLKPLFISDGGEGVEAVTIEIHVKFFAITVISAYGPQESAPIETKNAFWNYLSEEAHRSCTQGKGFILQGDLNSWLGPELIPGDCHAQNRNGKLFATFINENKLICVNSLPVTEGVITRSRTYLGVEKNSTIDFYVVCERVQAFVKSMKIDNGKKHMLTNYKHGFAAVNSDHRPLIMNVQLEVPPTKKIREEILDFKNPKSQIIFNEITTNTKAFTDCIDTMQPLSEQAKSWINNVKSHCKRAFKTIRIRTRNIKLSEADCLISKRNKFLKQGNTEQANILDAHIAKIIFKENRAKAFMFKKYMDKGETQPITEMWKLKKTLFPKKKPTLPSSKFNHTGKLVSEPKELVKLLGVEYGKIRLRKRPIHPMNMSHKPIREKLLRIKLNSAAKRTTPDLKMKDLEHVLKGLKSNKARDPDGLIRTIFKNSIAGSNLKASLLKLFNTIKREKVIPEFMKRATIATIPKKG